MAAGWKENAEHFFLGAFSRVASSAAAAALALRQCLVLGTCPRMALHTGEAEREGGGVQRSGIGIRGARNLIAANPGQTLCSERYCRVGPERARAWQARYPADRPGNLPAARRGRRG